jgi:hypothetical protein
MTDGASSGAILRIGLRLVVFAGEVEGESVFPNFKHRPQIKPGSTFV